MALGQMNRIVGHLRKTLLVRDVHALPDGQLLEEFLARAEEGALEALVRRHGPMVLGVCRRILHHAQDAEDAFQATFLVLVRKAASIKPREMVANWLYGVAYRTALKARSAAAQRCSKEKQVKIMPEPMTRRDEVWDDLQPLLDRELSRLPDKYRVPVVLCDLEGKTQKEAAQILGCPLGTLSSRLTRARKTLASRLSRRGVVLSGGGLAAVLVPEAAAGVPPALLSSTVKAATTFAAGQGALVGAISPKVAALTEGVLKAMLLTKLKIALVGFLILGVAGMGASWFLSPSPAADSRSGAKSRVQDPSASVILDRTPPSPVSSLQAQKDTGKQKDDGQQNQKEGGQQNQNDDGQKNQNDDGQKNQNDDGQKNQKDDGQQNQVEGVIKAVNSAKKTITVSRKDKNQTVEATYDLNKDLQILYGKSPLQLTDLGPGTRVSLTLTKDKKAVERIRVTGK